MYRYLIDIDDLARMSSRVRLFDCRAVLGGPGRRAGCLAGFDEPALYLGSWSEWIADAERPVAP